MEATTPQTKPKRIVTLSQVSLTPSQLQIVKARTPAEFIKTKPGRGGSRVRYVEGGYVVAKLNQVFGALNWEFTVKERGETARKNEKNSEGEVWVYGELSIVDHKKGFKATKGQFGQHPIHTNVPMGDAYKSAETDALKKCASMLGIALDVYWRHLDDEPESAHIGKLPTKTAPVSAFDKAVEMIKTQTDEQTLIEWHNKLLVEQSSLYTREEQVKLLKLINAKIPEQNA